MPATVNPPLPSDATAPAALLPPSPQETVAVKSLGVASGSPSTKVATVPLTGLPAVAVILVAVADSAVSVTWTLLDTVAVAPPASLMETVTAWMPSSAPAYAWAPLTVNPPLPSEATVPGALPPPSPQSMVAV